MKTLEQLKKLNVLAINEGTECGAITELIIDPVKKKADFIVVDDRTGCLGLKLLPVESVKSAGVEFLTISSKNDLKSFGDLANALKNKLSSKQLIGLRAISGEGFTIGSVSEISFNEKTGDIVELKISESAGIASENLVAITSKMVTAKSDSDKLDHPVKASVKHTLPASMEIPEQPAAAKVFKQRSHEFLIGKTAIKDIFDNKGEILVKEGEVITEPIIKMLEGKNEIVKLIMNVSKD